MANTVKVQGSKTVARARKGEDGKGIVSQVDYYGISSDSGTRPTSWVTGTPPLMTQTNKYLWKYTRTTYSDGSYTDTTPGIVGVFGDSGLSYRYSKWEEGFEYRNDNNPFYRDSNGKGIIDVVFADDISIWDPATDPNNPPAAWICRQTHTSASARPLPSQGQSNAYWTAMNSTAPILTALVLARKIKADEIDVDTLHVKHLDGADGSFSGVLSFPFVGLINNATFDYSTGGGQDMYYTMHNDVMSVEIYYSDRFYGSPYASTPRYNHFELPSNVPDGTVLNIMAAAINYKDTARPVYFSGNIYYGTNPSGSYMGSSLLKATEIMVKDTFFLRMMSYGGNWYMLSNMGEFEVTAT